MKSEVDTWCHCRNFKNKQILHSWEWKKKENLSSLLFVFFSFWSDRQTGSSRLIKNSKVNKLISQTLWETRRVCVSQSSKGEKNQKNSAAAGREIPLPSGGRWRSQRHPTWGRHSTNNYSWAESQRRPRHYADPSHERKLPLRVWVTGNLRDSNPCCVRACAPGG